MPPDQRIGLHRIEHRLRHDMCAARDRGHRANIAERPAQRHRGEIRRARRIAADPAHHRHRMRRDRALGVDDQLGLRGRPPGGVDEAGIVGAPDVGRGAAIAFERGETIADHAADRLSVCRIDRRPDAGKIDCSEAAIGDQDERCGTREQIAHLMRAKAGVHMDRECAKPRDGEDRGEIQRAVGQPQRDPVATRDTVVGKLRGECFRRRREPAPVERPHAFGDRRATGTRGNRTRQQRGQPILRCGCVHVHLRRMLRVRRIASPQERFTGLMLYSIS